MIESKHRSKLHELLRPHVYALGTTGVAQNGVADAWYSGYKADLWCEHKRFSQLPREIDLTKPRVTTFLQQDWLRARRVEGRNVSMLIFVDRAYKNQTGCLMLYGSEWELPIRREIFLQLMKTRREVAEEIIDFVGAIPGGPGL